MPIKENTALLSSNVGDEMNTEEVMAQFENEQKGEYSIEDVDSTPVPIHQAKSILFPYPLSLVQRYLTGHTWSLSL